MWQNITKYHFPKKETSMRTKIDLNGLWDYRIGMGEFGKIQVPYSARTVGQSVCRRYFDRPAYLCERVFLIFEGTTPSVTASLP